MVAKPDLGSGAFVRMGSSPFARTFFRDRGVFLGLFFLRLLEESWRTTRLSSNYKTQIRRPLSGRTLTKKHHKSTPWIDRRPRRGLSPEGERNRLSPFRPLARFLEIEECSPVSFFCRLRELFEETLHPSLTKAR